MRGRGGLIFLVLAAILLLAGARTIAGWVLDYEWWREIGQVPTWISMMLYSVGPGLACWLLAFIVFWTAHARGMKSAGTGMGARPMYARLATLVILAGSALYVSFVMDSWVVVRYLGGHGTAAQGWRDPIYGQPLSFYLFDLPFYRLLLGVGLSLVLLAAILHAITAHSWRAFRNIGDLQQVVIDIRNRDIAEAFASRFFRGLLAVFLLGLAVWFYLRRYDWLMADHGFMVGVNWTAEHVRLPLQWLTIAACLAAAAAVWLGRLRWAAMMVIFPVLGAVVPTLVTTAYVKPNEISIERPYIQHHIEATRRAYAIEGRVAEKNYPARLDARVDVARNRALFDNVRLWDWRAFHDTVSQIQPLRPYAFTEPDVDRYTIDGALRQVLVSPREIDLNQLGDARYRWTNPNLVYTHGYGLVLAEANRIDANGLPELFIRNAPVEILNKSLKLTRPELYYGETVHEPVFVNTSQPEFNYPSGAENVHTRYEGTGGFAISGLGMRLAAALVHGDWNILLTSQLTPGSRMMVHRVVGERLRTVASFIQWDSDPYLVVGADGRLTWMADGYLTSNSHPYSRSTYVRDFGSFNYIRNSVKATVDAYNGAVKLYVFDPSDPLIQAYRNLFPHLFASPESMPADLRAHTRYPETLFAAQSEIYRTYHMQDPEAFYNKADLWDIAGWTRGQDSRPEPTPPVYVVATMPGEAAPEFVLMIPFTPHSKDNLIGVMMARCDGPKLGELHVLLLQKSETIYGPMQIAARVQQDQNISKDLTLWNQQGSQVLHGQMLVLPVDGTFVYVHPIYIQAREARMPQLKKVVLAAGNTLIYTDTWEQALAQLAGTRGPETAQAPADNTPKGVAAPAAAPAPGRDSRIEVIRGHLERYRSLASQGKWAEAGKELEAIEGLVRK